MKQEIEISSYGNLLVYKKGHTIEFIHSTIKKRKLRGLRIFTDLKEDKLADLNFLKECGFLEVLSITSGDDHDLSFLSALIGLKELSIITQGKNEIDLSNQVNLETLAIQWWKGKVLGLEKCQNLTSLCLIDFKEKDFLPISQLTKLKELTVKTASIKNLNGINNFLFLENLSLGYCRYLEDIAHLSGLKNLISLEIDHCAKIRDYTSIGSLFKLENLVLRDCKGINSIKFIQGLQSLNKLSLSGNTDVLDGDLIPAVNVKQVFHKHREHYNVKIENKEYADLIKSNLEKIRGF
ncbi:MAG TPA: hypothetical protein VGI43_08205 [Mucilaginibacter sp.]|jgi:Leucine-rich repeat (LRR) protein